MQVTTLTLVAFILVAAIVGISLVHPSTINDATSVLIGPTQYGTQVGGRARTAGGAVRRMDIGDRGCALSWHRGRDTSGRGAGGRGAGGGVATSLVASQCLVCVGRNLNSPMCP